ncbi:hypothetical protein BDV96DRAFT_580623 [Lophiotrema nucula]|uniref:Uncharacterized protein n=1 Tax=Lophiotrema nucula TaxID=690887 RepID=A0A6A5YYZ2_9PLEO|nr:hypothetical protein BDV96DRAFT_580623 [Lophiotrema nucula]
MILMSMRKHSTLSLQRNTTPATGLPSRRPAASLSSGPSRCGNEHGRRCGTRFHDKMRNDWDRWEAWSRRP